jgi:hypothetical protein
MREDPRLSDLPEELNYRLAVPAALNEEAPTRRADADGDDDMVVSALPLTAAQLSSFGVIAAAPGGFASGFLSVPKHLTRRGRVTPLRWHRKSGAGARPTGGVPTAKCATRSAFSPTPLQPLPRRTPFSRQALSPACGGGAALAEVSASSPGARPHLNSSFHNNHAHHLAPNARLFQSSLAMHALAPRRTLAAAAAAAGVATCVRQPFGPAPRSLSAGAASVVTRHSAAAGGAARRVDRHADALRP